MKKQHAFVGSLLTVCASAALCHGQCTVSFAPVVNYVAGSGPDGVAVGDFNGDGIPDLAVANWGDNNVSILLGYAFPNTGTFQAAVNYAADANPRSVAWSDFNGDGISDLAVANQNSQNVSVLLGSSNGTGTFQVAVDYSVAVDARPVAVAVGDFNADGRPDLAVANSNTNNVSILLGSGPPNNGTFQTAVHYAVGGASTSIASGDFNADGRHDLAVANNSGISILLGNAEGTFEVAVNYSVGTGPRSVAVGDFNADGTLDLAVANATSNNVSVLLGNLGGTFQAAIHYAADDFPVSVGVGDFNVDGWPDLAVANSSSNDVSILLGNSDGTFQGAVNYPVGTGARSVAVGDFNSDGRPDLAVANANSNNVSVLLNTSAGRPTITQQPANQLAQAGQTTTVAITCDDHGVPFNLQWRRNGEALSDGGHISGATTDTLTINPTALSDAGVYDVVVTNECGSVTSDPATLTVECAADFNHNGAATVQDIFDFLAAFFAGDIAHANFNGDCCISPQDIFDFLAAFFAGCP